MPVRWNIVIDPDAAREIDDLDGPVNRRVWKFLKERVASYDDPRCNGEALKGTKLGDLWRYRVGDYRVFVRIQDQSALIFVAAVLHRSIAYRH